MAKLNSQSRLISVGRIWGPWGLKGDLKVDWNNEEPPVGLGGRVFARFEGGKGLKAFIVERLKKHGRFFLLGLKGMDREAAEKVVKKDLWMEEKDLPLLNEGEYYSYQILGMKVFTEDGEELGEVREIICTGSNDVYVVRKGNHEHLIPAISDVVKSLDVEAKKMVIFRIEGLLE